MALLTTLRQVAPHQIGVSYKPVSGRSYTESNMNAVKTIYTVVFFTNHSVNPDDFVNFLRGNTFVGVSAFLWTVAVGNETVYPVDVRVQVVHGQRPLCGNRVDKQMSHGGQQVAVTEIVQTLGDGRQQRNGVRQQVEQVRAAFRVVAADRFEAVSQETVVATNLVYELADCSVEETVFDNVRVDLREMHVTDVVYNVSQNCHLDVYISTRVTMQVRHQKECQRYGGNYRYVCFVE